MTRRKNSTPGNQADEARLVTAALRAVPDDDLAQDAAIALLEKQRAGEEIVSPKRLARVIAKNHRVDMHRRHWRETRQTSEPVALAAVEVDLNLLKRQVRYAARAEARERRWPGYWWFSINGLLSPCATCGGRGVLTKAGSDEWIRHDVRPSLRAELGAEAILVPPLCQDCGATGDGPATTDANDSHRKRRRKTARERFAKAKAHCAAKGELDGEFATAAFDVSAERAIGLRRSIVEALCPLGFTIDAAGVPAQERTPTARDLALAALIVGDWPIPEASDDWKRLKVSEIITAETRAMRKAHADAEAAGLVRELPKAR